MAHLISLDLDRLSQDGKITPARQVHRNISVNRFAPRPRMERRRPMLSRPSFST
jgi:hypothetical protein